MRHPEHIHHEVTHRELARELGYDDLADPGSDSSSMHTRSGTYNDVEDTQQQVELTVDPTLLKLEPPHETPVKFLGRELRLDYEGESEDGNNEGEDDGIDDDDRSSLEDADVSPPTTRWWTRELRASQPLQETDGDSSGGFGSDDDSRSTQAAESSSSSALSDGGAFEVLTVYSDVSHPWREEVESLSSGTAEEAEPGRRVGRAEPGDEHEGARTLAVPSPEKSCGSDVEERGASDEECTPTTGNPKSDESGAEELPNACPAWMFVPRGLFNGGVKPTAGRCAAYCNPHQLDMSVLAQRKDILRDLGLAVVVSKFGVDEGVGTSSSLKAQPSQLSL
ncbi:hypothetical protein FRC05_006060 [Tulasnella sp. 425]|nr:hypothetical protein FRC05_006060 [Tulasnella sp. 425]